MKLDVSSENEKQIKLNKDIHVITTIEIPRAKEKLNTITHKLEQMRTKERDLRLHVAKLETEKSALTSDIQKVKAEIEITKENISKSQKEVELKKNVVAQLSIEVGAVQGQIKETKSQIEKQEQIVSKNERDLTVLLSEVKLAENDLMMNNEAQKIISQRAEDAQNGSKYSTISISAANNHVKQLDATIKECENKNINEDLKKLSDIVSKSKVNLDKNASEQPVRSANMNANRNN